MTITITGVKRIGSIDMVASDKGPQLSFVEEYHVLADDILSTQWEVMRDAVATDPAVVALLGYNGGVQTDHLPYPGVTVARDGTCICKSLGGEKDERNARKWTFSAQWVSDLGNRNQQQSPSGDNPQMDPEQIVPLRETLYEPVTRSRSIDLVGRGYVNSAGNLYNPALTVEEELPRWDWAQFEPYYDGVIAGSYDTYSDLATGVSDYAILTTADITTTPGTVYPPGVYYGGGGTWVFAAPTDATTFYFNGCVNQNDFLGCDKFTLLLKVRSSKIVSFYGKRRRYTEYTVVYDKQNHWDKPLNAGPFFVAKQLDDAGNETAVDVQYPYIYYTRDVEDSDTDLAINQDGPLGSGNITIADPLVAPYTTGTTDALPVGDGPFFRTYKVQQDGGKWVYRAGKCSPDNQYFYTEFINHDVLDFASYLRIV
jgi:hypothetical protein